MEHEYLYHLSNYIVDTKNRSYDCGVSHMTLVQGCGSKYNVDSVGGLPSVDIPERSDLSKTGRKSHKNLISTHPVPRGYECNTSRLTTG